MSVLFNEVTINPSQKLGHITLNSDKTLNALSHDMIKALQSQLMSWENDRTIVAVFIDSSSARAFCAGGDIKNLYHGIAANRVAEVEAFFENEYSLNYRIHTYPKPIIAWGEGLIMGGGMGLFNGASHRIVCADSQLSMPEMKIGFFPDVGASYFLQKLVANAGLFVGLTAEFIKPLDAILHQLADYAIDEKNKHAVLDCLLNLPWTKEPITNHALIDNALKSFDESHTFDFTESEYLKNFTFLLNFSRSESIVHAINLLQKASQNNAWLNACYLRMAQMSPFACAVFFHQMKVSRHLSLQQVFGFERDMAHRMMHTHDLSEGIRALLIDKDNNPKWQYSNHNLVDTQHVNAMFQPTQLPPIH